MSSKYKQGRLNAGDTPAPHLLNESKSGNGLNIDNEREYYCADCSWRVTVSPDNQREYGHGPECEHRLIRDGPVGGLK